MDVLPFDEFSQVRKIPFLGYLKNRINFSNSRRKLRIILFFVELFALQYEHIISGTYLNRQLKKLEKLIFCNFWVT